MTFGGVPKPTLFGHQHRCLRSMGNDLLQHTQTFALRKLQSSNPVQKKTGVEVADVTLELMFTNLCMAIL